MEAGDTGKFTDWWDVWGRRFVEESPRDLNLNAWEDSDTKSSKMEATVFYNLTLSE